MVSLDKFTALKSSLNKTFSELGFYESDIKNYSAQFHFITLVETQILIEYSLVSTSKEIFLSFFQSKDINFLPSISNYGDFLLIPRHGVLWEYAL